MVCAFQRHHTNGMGNIIKIFMAQYMRERAITRTKKHAFFSFLKINSIQQSGHGHELDGIHMESDLIWADDSLARKSQIEIIPTGFFYYKPNKSWDEVEHTKRGLLNISVKAARLSPAVNYPYVMHIYVDGPCLARGHFEYQWLVSFLFTFAFGICLLASLRPRAILGRERERWSKKRTCHIFHSVLEKKTFQAGRIA